MATRSNQLRPVIVKKVIVEAHAGHHGGAWKVAYADFVTAMMAFFLVMWLIGATNEKQRRALADYFAPTLVQQKEGSAGSNGIFGGESIVDKDNLPHKAAQTGGLTITVPRAMTQDEEDKQRKRFTQLSSAITKRLASDEALRKLAKNIRFSMTRDGLRIDMVDEANFSMFVSGTDTLTPDAVQLLATVSTFIKDVPNGLIIRGHTDAAPFSQGSLVNNWQLSAGRAERTRMFLARRGVPNTRFNRIEGVADREPYVVEDRFDPRNRRMSITLGWDTSGALTT